MSSSKDKMKLLASAIVTIGATVGVTNIATGTNHVIITDPGTGKPPFTPGMPSSKPNVTIYEGEAGSLSIEKLPANFIKVDHIETPTEFIDFEADAVFIKVE